MVALILKLFRKSKKCWHIDFELFSKKWKMLTTLTLYFFRKSKKCWLHWYLVLPSSVTTLILNFSEKVKNVDTLILYFFEKVKNVDYIDIWYCLHWWRYWFWFFSEKVKNVDYIDIIIVQPTSTSISLLEPDLAPRNQSNPSLATHLGPFPVCLRPPGSLALAQFCPFETDFSHFLFIFPSFWWKSIMTKLITGDDYIYNVTRCHPRATVTTHYYSGSVEHNTRQ
jgi:hypothetical protein